LGLFEGEKAGDGEGKVDGTTGKNAGVGV